MEKWFTYPIKPHPHHTDYAGVVWHGSYISWMEEARIEYLHSVGVDFADLVALGCDLPVVSLAIRYHRPMLLGTVALLKVRIADFSGVRINWEHRIESKDGKELYFTAQVTLVPVDREKGKIMRKLPPVLQAALAKPVV